MRVFRSIMPVPVVLALFTAIVPFLAAGCGSDSGTGPDGDTSTETLEFGIVDGGLPMRLPDSGGR